MARSNGVDLVEIAPTATPPVCRLVDYGKFRYEQAKKDKESKKHQHANRVKEIQLSANIDPHDFGVKLTHAIDFLCEDMKVKVTLRFRGREMAHQDIGREVLNQMIDMLKDVATIEQPPRVEGRNMSMMLSKATTKSTEPKPPRLAKRRCHEAVPLKPVDRAVRLRRLSPSFRNRYCLRT